MSLNTGNTTITDTQMGIGLVPHINANSGTINWNPKTNFRITERHKEGIGKMMGYFDSLHNFCKGFKVHIGFLEDGHTPHIITLEGSAIAKHLGEVLVYEVYGEDGRDILNGMRECYRMNIKD